MTDISVDSADDAAEKARGAGGAVAALLGRHAGRAQAGVNQRVDTERWRDRVPAPLKAEPVASRR
jgi:hypothetical protein